MKKIFALALAAVMTAGMTTVAFAADETTVSFETAMFVLDDGEATADNKLTGDYVEGGDEIAIPVILDGGNYYVINSDFDKKLVVDEDWDVNEADPEFRFVK